MINKLKIIRNTGLYKLTFWTLISQAIVFVLSPITTRLFSPAQFGLYTLATSVISMVVPILSFKFDALIVTEKNEEDMEKAISISYKSVFFISFITALLYFLYGKFTEINISVSQIILIFLILIITGISNIGVSYANRIENYSSIGQYNFLRSLFQNLLLVLVGFLGFGIVGMLISMLVGNFFGLNKIMKGTPKVDSKKNINLKYYFFNNINLVKYSLPAHFINSFSYTIVNFLIVDLYNTTIFGYYSLAYRVLMLPLMIITQNMSKIFFKEASHEWNNSRSYSVTLTKNLKILLVISIPMTLVLFYLSPVLFSFVFGKNWIVTGEFVRILSFMFGIRLIVSSLMTIFIVIGEQKKELVFQCLFMISSLILFIFAKIFSLSVYVFLGMISISYSLIYIYILFYIFLKRKG